jgi:hypothetical protein
MAAEAEHRYKASLVASDVVLLKLNFEQQAQLVVYLKGFIYRHELHWKV